jgi:hypothetical protein
VQWITSYASIYHRPGVPLFDPFARGKSSKDKRMYFSWFAGDYTTDKSCENLSPEEKANPSRMSWGSDDYLETERGPVAVAQVPAITFEFARQSRR